MTSDAIFTYTTEYGSITFKKASKLWLTNVEGLSDIDITISTTQGAGQTGVTISNMSLPARPITLNGVILSNVEPARRNILDIFAPAVLGDLSITDRGETWIITATCTTTPIFSDGDYVQEFQIPLTAPYPLLKSSQTQTTALSGIKPLFKFPFYTGGEWKLSERVGDLLTRIENTGNFPVPLQITFVAEGTVTNPIIEHIDTDTFIKLNKTMSAGDRVLINTEYGRRSVVYTSDGVSENGLKYTDILSNMSMSLLPGTNTFKYEADANRDGLIVNIIAPKGVRSGI